MNDKKTMSKETLYWTIGGVAIALLALFAMSRGSSASTAPATTTGGGGINASSLVSEVNNANNNAAAVEGQLLSAESAYLTHTTDAQANVFTAIADNATAQLQAVEQAGTDRYAAGAGAAAAEYADNANALTAQFEAAQQTAQVASSNAAAVQESLWANQTAKGISDNEATIARINKGPSFGNFMQSLLGAASSIFGGGVNPFATRAATPAPPSAPAPTGGFASFV